MYEGYDDNEIGALDTEEIEGHVLESSDLLLQYANDFEKEHRREHLDKDVISNKIMEQLGRDSDEDDLEDMKYVEVGEKEKWDCETILSTYSNLYNHPKLIKEPPVSFLIIIYILLIVFESLCIQSSSIISSKTYISILVKINDSPLLRMSSLLKRQLVSHLQPSEFLHRQEIFQGDTPLSLENTPLLETLFFSHSHREVPFFQEDTPLPL